MPKPQKEIHRKAFALFTSMGGIANKEFLAAFEKEFGKTARTFWNWYKDFGWGTKSEEQVEEAVENLQEAGILNAEELISGFLDLCRHRMSEVGERAEYFKAVFATAFDRIPSADNPNPGKPSEDNPNPEKPLQVDSIKDMVDLTRAQAMLMREEQAWARLCLTLVGKPEQIMEDRMIVELVGLDENVFTNAEQSVADTASTIPETDKEAEDKA